MLPNCTHVYKKVCAYACVYMHTHTHTHTHICTHCSHTGRKSAIGELKRVFRYGWPRSV